MSKFSPIWFLIGLGSGLQVIASLSITEAFVLAMAPILIAQDWEVMRKHGVLPFFRITLLLPVGSLIACLVNEPPAYFFLRGMAVSCIVPCSVVFAHHFLNKDMNGVKWFFVGGVISMFLNTFIFQSVAERVMLAGGASGEKAVEAIMSGPVYWMYRLKPLVTLPIRGWYLSTPLFYSIIAPLGFAVFSLLLSGSGRSTALVSFMAVVFTVLGRKKIRTMRLLSKHFMLFIFVGFSCLFLFKVLYQKAALSGMLGDAHLKKYVQQTKGKNDIVSIIMGGRLSSFVGYLACLDRPIVGFGPFALDEKGYTEEFLKKYGNEEDYDNYLANLAWESGQGMTKCHVIPAHSSIVVCWLQFGIAGLIFWVYVLYALYRYLRFDVAVVPQWYGWLACGAPGILWDAFFSPFSGRLGVPMFIVACLLARAIRQRKMNMPFGMIAEIAKAERRR